MAGPNDSIIDLEAYQSLVAESRASLIGLVTRMLDCLISQSRDEKSGLVKNFVDGDETPAAEWAFGDAAKTTLNTSAIYRPVVLVPE